MENLSSYSSIQVNNCLTAPADSDIKVEDLEGLLADMKKMFIDKQKMVDGLNANATPAPVQAAS